jgi:hypothetical protein
VDGWYARKLSAWKYPLLVLLAGLLALPSLGVGFFLDDYVHLAAVRGQNPIASRFDVFCFAPGDPGSIQKLMDEGPYPWFTATTIKVHFFRPLSSALMALDYALFGKASAGYHLHSLLWYLALAAVVAGLMRRTLGGALGALALLIFVVDESHAFPVVWWSNRNAVVAATLALLGILAHLRWREEGWKPGAPLSLLGYAAAFLAGESALGVLGYLLAYELLAARGGMLRRLAHLAPAAALAAAYLLAYKAMGYGVQGMQLYLDPMAVPLEFLLHAPGRFLVLAATQFLSFPSELPAMLPVLEGPSAAVGAISVFLVVMGLRHAWPTLDPVERRALRWLGAGAAFSVIPFLAAFTSGRLLIVPSVGGSVVLAVLIRHGYRVWRSGAAVTPKMTTEQDAAHCGAGLRPASRSCDGGLRSAPDAGRRPAPQLFVAKALFIVFVGLHLVIAPLTWPALSWGFGAMARGAERVVMAAELDDTKIAQQRIFVIAAPDPVVGFYPVAMRGWRDRPKPAAWCTLSMAAPFDHRITRTGPDRFLLTVEDGQMFTTMPEALLRDVRYQFEPGSTVHTAGYDVTVLEMGAIGPRQLEVRFRNNLEDPNYVFLSWENGTLRRLQMPPLGESLLLPKDAGIPDWALPAK